MSATRMLPSRTCKSTRYLCTALMLLIMSHPADQPFGVYQFNAAF
jgi:hypothetical protein